MAAVLSVSPLALTVAHFGTGDVGVDLATALAILAVVMAANSGHRRAAWLVLAGAAVGFGFAAKFQGLLVLYVVLLYLFLQDLWLDRRVKVFGGHVLCVLGGLLSGAAVAMPELLIDWNRSVELKIANFKFIAEYAVSEEVLNMALPARMLYSYRAVCSGEVFYPITCRGPGELPPGEYDVWLGVYNTRTRLRLPLTVPEDTGLERDDDRVRVGYIVVTAGE